MPLFGRRKSKIIEEKQPELAQSPTEDASKKELYLSTSNAGNNAVYEKGNDIETPASATSTALPVYREQDFSTVSRTLSQTRSTAFSSTGSSDIAPDVHPVTQNMLSADHEKEVYLPENTPTSQPLPSRARQASRSYREYNFYYTNAMTHLVICDPDHKVLSFAEMSPFAKGISDVSMRTILDAGFDDLASKGPHLGLKEAQSAPVTAVADTFPSSMNIKIGTGDPLQPQTQKWTVLQNVHYDSKTNSEKYDVTYSSSDGKALKLLWIRGVADDASEKGDSKELYRVLSDDGMIASFRTASLASIKKRGALRVYDTDSLETLNFIFVTCAALLERERRRKVKKGLLMGFSSSKKS